MSDVMVRRRMGKGAGAAVVAVAAGLVALSACGSSSGTSAGASGPTSTSASATPVASSGTSGSTGGAGGSGSVASLLATGYKGTFTAPPASGPKAASGKDVWVISCGQVAPSCSTFANSAMAAGQAAGWSMHLYDAKLNPANYTVGIDQAIAAGANGLVTVAVDCDLAKAALAQAKSAGVKTVGIVSFDCDDPLAPTGSPVYSTFVKFHGEATAGQAVEDWDRYQAAWLINATDAKAKIIRAQVPGFLISTHTEKGFEAEISTCSGCSIVDRVDITPTDLVGGTAASKMQSAIIAHPEANAVSVGDDAYFPQFADQALKATGYSKYKVMGGECLDATVTAAIRAGGPEMACVGIPYVWEGWASIDELNRQFAAPGSAPVDEGIGFQIVDATHNLPASGAWTVPVDFEAAYKKVWTGQ